MVHPVFPCEGRVLALDIETLRKRPEPPAKRRIARQSALQTANLHGNRGIAGQTEFLAQVFKGQSPTVATEPNGKSVCASAAL